MSDDLSGDMLAPSWPNLVLYRFGLLNMCNDNTTLVYNLYFYEVIKILIKLV